MRTLRAVQAYIARRSPRYADAMIQRIVDRSELLSQYPMIGAVVAEYDDEQLRELLEGPFRIIYRNLPDQVDVIAVIHAARMMPPNPPGAAE